MLFQKKSPALQYDLPKGNVVDLDDVIVRPVTFIFKGREHLIKPINLGEFFLLNNAFTAMARKQQTPQEIALSYFQLMSAVCDTIQLEDVLKMTQVQAAAMVALILRRLQGEKAESLSELSEEEKKKTQRSLN